MSHPQVINFGCRLNAFESEAIKEIFKKETSSSNLKNPNSEKADSENLIIFNSCAVTANAEKELRHSIRKIAKENPGKKIVVTGCAAQINPKEYAAMPEVDLVLGNQDKFNKESYFGSELVFPKEKKARSNFNASAIHSDKIFSQENNKSFIDDKIEAKILVNDIMAVKETSAHMISGFENHSRAFVQIQNGCNHRCTFCIIPYGRGNSRSVPFGEIVEQIRKLIKNGYQEIVLTGVDISDYGKDLLEGLTFSKMVKRLIKLIPELPRLRISSIDVAEIDTDFLDLLKNESRLMPYLHISLQSGDNLILKRMKRRHNREQVLDFCKTARALRPEITFGADIIAGFPTETEENFQNSLNLIKEAGIIFNHIFPYSARVGTPAAKMPQVPSKIRKERAAKLRKAGKEELEKFLTTQIGKRTSVILEENNIGRCENFITVKIDNLTENTKTGQILEVLITKKEGENLIAKI